MKRFWDKVEKTNTCWNWVGGSRGNGYGCIKYQKKVYDTHRFVWFLTKGVFPKQWILHKCNNRKCVNPDHLYEGTPKENYEDMRKAGNAHVLVQIFSKEEQIIKQRIYNKEWYNKTKLNPIKYKRWRSTQKK